MPTHGDFVRHNAGSAVMEALDERLREGLYRAQQKMKNGLDLVPEKAPAHRFLYAGAQTPRALVGVLRLSQDRNGRRYPFVVATEISDELLAPDQLSMLPVRFRVFFEQAGELVNRAVEGQFEAENIPPRLENIDTAPSTDALLRHERYLRDTTTRTFFERLWGDYDDTRKYLACKNLIDVLGPLNGNVPSGFKLGLRLPLCPDLKSLEADAGFWLELCLRFLGAEKVAPTLFWSASNRAVSNRAVSTRAVSNRAVSTRAVSSGEASAAGPFMLLFPGVLPQSALLHLVTPSRLVGDDICEMEQIGRRHAAHAALAIPNRVGKLLEQDSLSLWELLRRL